jgi:hypothetical protein
LTFVACSPSALVALRAGVVPTPVERRGVEHLPNIPEPTDYLVRKTTARRRRQINFWLLVAWVFPGTLIWLWLRDDLWFVGFMSIYAIWVTHWSGFSAETPVEEEEPVKQGSSRRARS